jgi:hypothetical protein
VQRYECIVEIVLGMGEVVADLDIFNVHNGRWRGMHCDDHNIYMALLDCTR